MKSTRLNLTLASAVLLAFSLPGFAQNSASHGAAALPASEDAARTAYASKAELALSYTGLFDEIIRKKNVTSVTNPDTGVFCIESAVPLNLKKIYPVVSIEWGESSGNALLAFWRDTSISTDCPTGWLEVQTFDFNAGGAPVASQNVAFDLVIE